MTKLHLPKFHFTKALLTAVGIGVIVALVLAGAAEAVHDRNVSQNQAAQAAIAQKKHEQAVNTQINDLQASVKAEQAKLVTVCNVVKQLALKNRTVAVPQVCTSTI